MPRSENGGIIGPRNFSTQSYAIGVYQLKSQFVANAGNQWPRSGSLFLAVAHNLTPFFSVYSFSALGFGAKISDPATLPTGTGNRVRFSPDSKNIAVSHGTSPFVSVYPYSGLGVGTKYSDPGTLPAGIGTSVNFNPSTTAIAVTFATTPGIHVYGFSSGFGSKFSDPATLPVNCYDAVFHPTGNEIATGSATSPYLYVYPWSNSSGFGSKYSNHPSNVTVADLRSLKWHPTGSFLSVGGSGTSTLSSAKIERTYGFDSGTGFNTTFFTTNSATEINGATGRNVTDLDISPDGSAISFSVTSTSATIGSSYVVTYAFNTSTGFTSLYTAPATLLPAQGNGTKFDSSGKFLAVAHNTTPFVTVYNWIAGTGYGTKITNPVTLPPSTGNGVDWVVV